MPNVLQGLCPSLIVAFFVEDSAMAGSVTKSPWYFNPRNVSSVEWIFNGQPMRTRKLEFQDDDFCRAYNIVLRDLNLMSSAGTIKLDKATFKKNMFLLSLDCEGQSTSSEFPL